MASTDHLKSLYEQMERLAIDAKGVARELVRDKEIEPKCASDPYTIHGALQHALGNLASSTIAKARTNQPIPRPDSVGVVIYEGQDVSGGLPHGFMMERLITETLPGEHWRWLSHEELVAKGMAPKWPHRRQHRVG